MKYKKIVSLCKEEKTVVSSASDSGELTWFGTNKALYPAYGLSVMTASEILRMNDVPEDKLEEYSTLDLPFTFDVDRLQKETDQVIEPLNVQIEIRGTRYKLFCDAEKAVLFVESAYTAPYADVTEEKMYILRKTSAGLRYIVVFRGLTPLAVLIPQKVPIPDMLYMESSMIAKTARREIESKQEDVQAEQTTL